MFKRKTWRKWTAGEERLLRSLVAEGKGAKEIGRILGRTPVAIDNKKKLLGICNTLKPCEPQLLLLAEVIKFRMAGWKLSDISTVLGVHASDLSQMLGQHGFKGFWCVREKPTAPYRYWDAVELHLFRKYLKKGFSAQRIHAEFPHRSLAAIRAKRTEMTRHWITPDEQSERAALKRKRLRVY